MHGADGSAHTGDSSSASPLLSSLAESGLAPSFCADSSTGSFASAASGSFASASGDLDASLGASALGASSLGASRFASMMGADYEPYPAGIVLNIDDMARADGGFDSQQNVLQRLLADMPGKLVVVECAASWREESQAIMPEVSRLAQHYADVLTVAWLEDSKANRALMNSWRVERLPTFVFLANSRYADKLVCPDATQLEQCIRSNVSASAAHAVPESCLFEAVDLGGGGGGGAEGSIYAQDVDVEYGGAPGADSTSYIGEADEVRTEEQKTPSVIDVLQGRVHWRTWSETLPRQAEPLLEKMCIDPKATCVIFLWLLTILYVALWIWGKLSFTFKLLLGGGLLFLLASTLAAESTEAQKALKRLRAYLRENHPWLPEVVLGHAKMETALLDMSGGTPPTARGRDSPLEGGFDEDYAEGAPLLSAETAV